MVRISRTDGVDHLQRLGERGSPSGRGRLDHRHRPFQGRYGAAKIAHEQAAQVHEFVPQLAEWGRREDVIQVPRMRPQVVAARTVAETVADVATSADGPDAILAGPTFEDGWRTRR